LSNRHISTSMTCTNPLMSFLEHFFFFYHIQASQ
jgi:hypothetical protein